MLVDDQQIEKTISKGKWSQEEDQLLKQLIEVHGPRWLQIASCFSNRNASQCSQRWRRIKPSSQKQLNWTQGEDQKILQLYSEFGKQWKLLSKFMPGRSSTSIRSRYMNQLNPKVVHTEFSQQEDKYIYERYIKLGPKWAQIAAGLKGRSSNQVKNRYYNKIRKEYFNIQNPYYIKESNNPEKSINVEVSFDFEDQMSSQMSFFSRYYI